MGSAPTASKLRVRSGENILARHHNGLADFAGALQIQRGRLKGRQDPDGFAPAVDVQTKTSVEHPFKISLGEDKDGNATLSFSAGFVSGIKPTIGDREIDDLDKNGDPPVLTIAEDAWDKLPSGAGERALVFFRYDLDKSFRVTAAQPVAFPKAPARAPWTWYKLAAILSRVDGSVSVKPMVFFNQYFDVANVSASGSFQPLPHAG